MSNRTRPQIRMNYAFHAALRSGLCLVLTLGLTLTAAAQDVNPTAPAGKSHTPEAAASMAELRDKRTNALAELQAASQPESAQQAAPPVASQEELLERRALLQQVVRGYDEQLEDAQRLEDARQRHAEIVRTSSTWNGFSEEPPFSIFLADQLWNTATSLRLTAEGLQSQLSLIQLRFDRARDSLRAAEERLRQASERLEAVKERGQSGRERWTRDLEDLRRRAAAVTVSAAESSRTRIEEELADTRARLNFAQRQLEAAEQQTLFAEADLHKVRTRLAQERRSLEEEWQQVVTDRNALVHTLRTSERRLEERLASPAAKGSAKEPPGITQARDTVELGRAQLDTLVLTGDLLKQLLDVVENERHMWERRFTLTHDLEPAKARETHERFAPLFTHLQASRNSFRQQLGVVVGHIGDLDHRRRTAATDRARRHFQEMLDTHRRREEVFSRALQRVDQAMRFLERWQSELREQRHLLPLSARLHDWRQRAVEIAATVWHFEVFAVEDTIEVEGKSITGRRGVTVGKILSALLILLIGYWICLYLARLIGRLAVTRFGLSQDVANLVRQWSQAVLITMLIIISLVSVKIPLTVFAFLGGAFAIGVGFGAQNLLKNVISGVLVLIERPLRVGDWIEVDNVRGRVTTIGLRSSTVRDAKGMETLIPNSSFLERNLTNWTYSSHSSRFSLRVGAPYGSAPQQIRDLLATLVREHPKVLKIPTPQVLLEDFGGQGFVFTVNYWLEMRFDMDSNEVASDLRLLIEHRFTEAGVKVLPG